MQVLHRLEADLSAEEHIHAHSKTIPNWSNVQHALAKAAMEGAHLQAAACTSTVSTDSTAQDASLQPIDAWSSAMEAAVTSVLLWAQAAQASGPAEAHKPGEPAFHCLEAYLAIFLSFLLIVSGALLLLAARGALSRLAA